MAHIRIFWERFGEKLLLGSALFFCLILAFFGGIFYERGQKDTEPLLVRIPDYQPGASVPAPAAEPEKTSPSAGLEPIAERKTQTEGKAGENCQFVGSKNSNKYHLPSCAPAKRIKPENLRCFVSQAAAEAAGYVPGCLK